MPHAVDKHEDEDERDNNLISELITGVQNEENSLDFLSRDLEPGEKANDAEDFEDIGDDDLADDEELPGLQLSEGNDYFNKEAQAVENSSIAINERSEEDASFDDLFGDQPSSPPAEQKETLSTDKANDQLFQGDLQKSDSPTEGALPNESTTDTIAPALDKDLSDPLSEMEIDLGDEEDPELLEQRQLFAQAQREREEKIRRGGEMLDLLPEPETNAELFETIWPHFEPDKPPRFHELLGIKKAFYLEKKPLKPPKPIPPTKLSLDLMQDQEKSFRTLGSDITSRQQRQQKAQQDQVVIVADCNKGEETNESEIELDTLEDDGFVGGIGLQDLRILCEDWENQSTADTSLDSNTGKLDDTFENPDAIGEDSPRSTKRRKIGLEDYRSFSIYEPLYPSLEDPEKTTERLSKRVALDLNDPELLVDLQHHISRRVDPAKSASARETSGSITKSLKGRYNISNDEAYDLLKENHQHKIRSNLGNLAIEHSLPALKLQYPFYKVKLMPREARSFHRPALVVAPNHTIRFSKPKYIKRKHLKGKDTQAIFNSTHDLSMGDNSSMLLLEYSEEYPTVLSNFGMGSRLINYYRRKDAEDTARPKLDVGETAVLLPQDKSPFSLFGNIEPGQTMPTLHNAMYRAPVFQQDTKSTDFLIIRSTTGISGSQWYIRNIENLFVVGQEFPSAEVPGTHSRKVTEAAKRRLKMISFRIYKKSKAENIKGLLSNELVRQHLPGTDIAQNRSKMREFMAYDKDTASWVPKKGDVIPDALTMREWIRPEDVCLLDAMQVGDRHLQDAGYNRDEADMEADDEEEKEGQSLEQQLAPWHTTKNFLNACQGKAMLQLHGEGDPSGRGEAFSFIKTSMKGGFKAIGESVEDKLDAKRQKDLGGHSYNVARQQKAYEDAVKRIWEVQRLSLSSNIEHSDTEMDVDDEPESNFNRGRTPKSEAGVPTPSVRRDDESASFFSRLSTGSQKGKVLKITRHVRDKYGNFERVEEIVRDPKVIREYVRRRKAEELSILTLSELKPTGDAAYDEQQKRMLLERLTRLERNKERRHAREKARGVAGGSDMSPSGINVSSFGGGKPAGTQRRCANCGQIGHIKTNKKLCPLLNGKMDNKEENSASPAGDGSTNNTPVSAVPSAQDPSFSASIPPTPPLPSL